MKAGESRLVILVIYWWGGGVFKRNLGSNYLIASLEEKNGAIFGNRRHVIGMIIFPGEEEDDWTVE